MQSFFFFFCFIQLRNKEKKPKEMFDTREVRSKNLRKFSTIFDIHAGPSWNPHAKPPKINDYETLMVEEMDDSGKAYDNATLGKSTMHCTYVAK